MLAEKKRIAGRSRQYRVAQQSQATRQLSSSSAPKKKAQAQKADHKLLEALDNEATEEKTSPRNLLSAKKNQGSESILQEKLRLSDRSRQSHRGKKAGSSNLKDVPHQMSNRPSFSTHIPEGLLPARPTHDLPLKPRYSQTRAKKVIAAAHHVADEIDESSEAEFIGRLEEEHGAFRMQGLDAHSIGITESEEMAQQEQQQDTNSAVRENNGEESQRGLNHLVSAHLVSETEEEQILAVAKRETWYQRNQYWLAAGLVILVLGIVLASVLPNIDLTNDATDSPTASPTTTVEGIQSSIQDIILAASTSPRNSVLNDPTSAQSRAVQRLTREVAMQTRDLDNESKIIQRYSLLTLYYATNGPTSWNQTEGWLGDDEECNWYGVTCTRNRVESLILSRNNLNGSLPVDISLLSNSLVKFNVSKNKLVGRLPSEIGTMTLLNDLSLQCNNFIESIPTTIGFLTEMRTMDLSSNSFSSTLPTELSQLTGLKSLSVSKNKLSGGIFSQIGRLTNLELFNCGNNSLTNPLPTELGAMIMLEVLEMQQNNLLGPLPDELGRLSNLRTMHLHQNTIFGSIPTTFAALSNLTDLDLSENIMEGEIPIELNLLTKLSRLNLRTNFLSGPLDVFLNPSANQNLKLHYLDISSNFLVGIVPFVMWDIPTLAHVNMSRNRFTGVFPFSVQMSNLEVLDISNNFAVSLRLPTELGVATKLSLLNIQSTGSSGTIPTEWTSLQNLAFLDFAQTQVEGTLPSFLGSLKSLDLFFTLVSGTIPSELFSTGKLEHLSLQFTNVHGTIPSTLGLSTNLRSLLLLTTLLTGQLPPEIWKATKLATLDLEGLRQLKGSFSTEVGRLTHLENLVFTSTGIGGRIPSEIGMVTNLQRLRLRESSINGTVPSNIGNLVKLEWLDLASTQVSGTLPTEVGLMESLTSLSIESTSMNGTMPSQLGLLTNLEVFEVCDTRLNGIVPQEIGQLIRLTRLELCKSQLSGTLPSEISLFTNLDTLRVAGSNLTGDIMEPLCSLITLDFSLDDTEQVTCSCCTIPSDPPTSPPFLPPPVQPEPTASPTLSLSNFPSTTLAPTSPSTCFPFVPIASTGTPLRQPGPSGESVIFDLPFEFPWLGRENYTRISVNPNGVIFLGTEDSVETGCCNAFPVIVGGFYNRPRIAVAHADFSIAATFGGLFAMQMEDRIIISWEVIPTEIYGLNFQCSLFQDGSVELNWGDGDFPPGSIVVAGLEDDAAGFAAAAAGAPFGPGGIADVWPAGECRRFNQVTGTYIFNAVP